MRLSDKVYMHHDKADHCYEFHYPDGKTVIFVNERIAQDDFVLALEFLRMIWRCCGYKFEPADILELVAGHYKNKKFDKEPKCIF